MKDADPGWLRLTQEKRRVVVEAVLVLSLVSCLRRMIPRRLTRRALTAAPRAGRTRNGLSPERIVALVDATAARVPFASSCLDRSIAARWILARRGIRAALVIGTPAAAPFAPHAWLDLSPRVDDTMSHRVLWHWP